MVNLMGAFVRSSSIKLSVVCPFYNEEIIIKRAIERMVSILSRFECEWELLVVNDGSVDGSLKLAEETAAQFSGVRVVGYPVNFGRGRALRYGIQHAVGENIVTTEIDCSWGDEIIEKMFSELLSNPKIDFVIASTNVRGGGYKNVPFFRVLISRFGNLLLRFLYGGGVTMYTGMTRAYRAAVIKHIPLFENGKEIHLEIIHKLRLLGHNFSEVPAVLEWQDHKLSDIISTKRGSSSRIRKLSKTHIVFGLATEPFKYLIFFAVLFFGMSIGLFLWGMLNLIDGEASIFLVILSALFFFISVFCSFASIFTYQNSVLRRELLSLSSMLDRRFRVLLPTSDE